MQDFSKEYKRFMWRSFLPLQTKEQLLNRLDNGAIKDPSEAALSRAMVYVRFAEPTEAKVILDSLLECNNRIVEISATGILKTLDNRSKNPKFDQE